jgi:hypothetical protein
LKKKQWLLHIRWIGFWKVMFGLRTEGASVPKGSKPLPRPHSHISNSARRNNPKWDDK